MEYKYAHVCMYDSYSCRYTVYGTLHGIIRREVAFNAFPIPISHRVHVHESMYK
jgi:hypothetical protein